MMFLFNLALAVQLITLGLGVMMLVWAYRTQGVGIAVARVFGYIITIAAAFLLICTVFHGMKYSKGYYRSHAPMMMLHKPMTLHRGEMMANPSGQ
ncbi:MAG: hypothetical protein A3F17_07655 [Gammaproteobacteria bacterium RIFCSPHIGHO2_12_FULL_41_15]|nr:MAG: hypothetical protein A3F17_07655 [Gammaproteobacteria bacterium RIFCSPHIGHO2_12_FULL_41_15]